MTFGEMHKRCSGSTALKEKRKSYLVCSSTFEEMWQQCRAVTKMCQIRPARELHSNFQFHK